MPWVPAPTLKSEAGYTPLTLPFSSSGGQGAPTLRPLRPPSKPGHQQRARMALLGDALPAHPYPYVQNASGYGPDGTWRAGNAARAYCFCSQMAECRRCCNGSSISRSGSRERDGRCAGPPDYDGSSLRTRGTDPGQGPRHQHVRFIPAYAGNGRGRRRRGPPCAVHPCVRGERISSARAAASTAGSSLRTRGTDGYFPPAVDDERFIPAYAGNGAHRA